MFLVVVMPTEGPVYMVEVVFFCCFFCFCHSFCMPILASRLLGASLAFSGYRGALIAAWVSPWSKPYASTDIKKKKKQKISRCRCPIALKIELRVAGGAPISHTKNCRIQLGRCPVVKFFSFVILVLFLT